MNLSNIYNAITPHPRMSLWDAFTKMRLESTKQLFFQKAIREFYGVAALG